MKELEEYHKNKSVGYLTKKNSTKEDFNMMILAVIRTLVACKLVWASLAKKNSIAL